MGITVVLVTRDVTVASVVGVCRFGFLVGSRSTRVSVNGRDRLYGSRRKALSLDFVTFLEVLAECAHILYSLLLNHDGIDLIITQSSAGEVNPAVAPPFADCTLDERGVRVIIRPPADTKASGLGAGCDRASLGKVWDRSRRVGVGGCRNFRRGCGRDRVIQGPSVASFGCRL